MSFVPTVDGSLTVMLPGEAMRAHVTRVVDRNTVIVTIGQPMTRGHSFRKGDLIACRRTPGVLGETWQAVEARAMAPLPEPEPKTNRKKAEKAPLVKREPIVKKAKS